MITGFYLIKTNYSIKKLHLFAWWWSLYEVPCSPVREDKQGFTFLNMYIRNQQLWPQDASGATWNSKNWGGIWKTTTEFAWKSILNVWGWKREMCCCLFVCLFSFIFFCSGVQYCNGPWSLIQNNLLFKKNCWENTRIWRFDWVWAAPLMVYSLLYVKKNN